jgi:hypothetical protein
MEDSTKVDWKYNAKDIPSFEVTKKVDGEMVTIDNRKKQILEPCLSVLFLFSILQP